MLSLDEMDNIMKNLSESRPIFHSEADFQFALAWEIMRQKKNNCEIRLEYPVTVKKESKSQPLDADNSKQQEERWYIDIVVKIKRKTGEWDWIPIELKYKTCIPKNVKESFEVKTNKDIESYHMKNQGAQDISRYLFWKDVHRIEILENDELRNEFLIDEKQRELHWRKGYVIFLTNDSQFWNNPLVDKNSNQEKGTIYSQFSMKPGKTVNNTILKWNWENKKPIDCQEGNNSNQSHWTSNYQEIKIKGEYKIEWKKYSNEALTEAGENVHLRYVIL